MNARALFLVASVLFVLFPSSARADGKLELSAAAAKAEVTVGDDIEVSVTLKNTGDEVEVAELTFDARSYSFELSVDGGKMAWDTQFKIKQNVDLVPIPRKKLKKDESWSSKMTIPAIAAGTWSVTALYCGQAPAVDTLPGIEPKLEKWKLKAAALTVKVKPGPNGETQVLARMNTNMGTMVWKFFPKDALTSGINFVRIAQSGWYDGKGFHRVDKGLGIVQGGAPKDNGMGEFPYSIPREAGLKHDPMRVGMARTGEPNSGSSQFYICVNESPHSLDNLGYAIFAEVVKGKDVVQTLFAVDVSGQAPKNPLKIESVKLEISQ